MAMSSSVLGKAIADLIIDANAPDDIKARITQQWTNIAAAIIDEVKKAEIQVDAGIAVQVSTGTGTGATTAVGAGSVIS